MRITDFTDDKRMQSVRAAHLWNRRLDNQAYSIVRRSLVAPGSLARLSVMQLTLLLNMTLAQMELCTEVLLVLQRAVPIGPLSFRNQRAHDDAHHMYELNAQFVVRLREALRYADMPWGMRRRRTI